MTEGLARWRRIADALDADIVAGRFPPGARLPTEAELAARFGANRHTVRRALAHLAERGRVRARRGSGTFVTDAAILYPITARTRFGEIAEGAGQATRAELLLERIAPASADLARQLGVPPGTPLRIHETRRAMGSRWASRATHWLVAARTVGLAEAFREKGSLTAAFAAIGVRGYHRRRSAISAALADARSSRASSRSRPGAPSSSSTRSMSTTPAPRFRS